MNSIAPLLSRDNHSLYVDFPGRLDSQLRPSQGFTTLRDASCLATRPPKYCEDTKFYRHSEKLWVRCNWATPRFSCLAMV